MLVPRRGEPSRKNRLVCEKCCVGCAQGHRCPASTPSDMWRGRHASAPHSRLAGMFTLGMIIGPGTSEILKNIISERGLDTPRG